MPLTIIRQDITMIRADAIVNAANTALEMGRGVCGAIFRAAGADKLRAACEKAAPIKTGEAAITPAFALQAKYIIHAAGPVYSANRPDESERLLHAAYSSSLALARSHGCKSIAFPLISSGIYGYPADKALETATSAIREFLAADDMDIYLVIYDKASFAISRGIATPLRSYIDDNYIAAHSLPRRSLLGVERKAIADASAPCPAPLISAMPDNAALPGNISDALSRLDEPFSVYLMKLIDKKGKTDVEVYKRANIDRKLFSKIRAGKGYMPGKRTVLALAIALELDLAETDALLENAGFALSHSRKFDVIVEYFIASGKYDIFEVNEALFYYDQPLLGS